MLGLGIRRRIFSTRLLPAAQTPEIAQAAAHCALLEHPWNILGTSLEHPWNILGKGCSNRAQKAMRLYCGSRPACAKMIP
jgi:hypothetical protein